MPAVEHGRRLASRLRSKAAQAERSGAKWLFCDVHSEMWRLTPWSRLPLDEKAAQLAEVVRRALGDAHHLRGVVLTDGAGLVRPRQSRDAWFGAGIGARTVRLDALRVRESIVCQLNPPRRAVDAESHDDFAIWQRLLAKEETWLPEALGRVGLQVPPELRC